MKKSIVRRRAKGFTANQASFVVAERGNQKKSSIRSGSAFGKRPEKNGLKIFSEKKKGEKKLATPGFWRTKRGLTSSISYCFTNPTFFFGQAVGIQGDKQKTTI